MPTPYQMSEVWFDPKAFRRRAAGKDVYTDHGESRDSCGTCQKILPMMMCELSRAIRTEDELSIQVPMR